MQGLLDAVNRHAAAVGMRINASKTKVMSALVPDEQRQAVLLDGETLEDVEKFKYLGSMFVANGQGTEEIRSRINLARSAFSSHVAQTGQHPWLHAGWKIRPTRIGYCSNTNCARRFRCGSNNVDFTHVKPHYYRVQQVEPCHQLGRPP